MSRFKGFSTVGKVRPPYTVLDSELVKRDLLNEFYTRLGERPMRPTFGSIVWDLLMDPNTPDLQEAIQTDVDKIVERDPRVTLLNTRILILDHAIRIEIDLRFIPTESEDTLFLEYKRNITEGIN
jgi:phage baseplate assembly protein W